MADVPFRPPHSALVASGQVSSLARDMTAIIAADVPLERVQQQLSQHGQWLPVDGDPRRAVGQLVERNSSGPLRLGFGAWRDLLLGVQFNNGLGELITVGGRTVKNVAGYDLTKFMVGQRGVFGRVVTITTRTYRRPAGALAARFPLDVQLAGGLLGGDCRPQWMLARPGELWCGYLADARTLAYYASRLAGAGAAAMEGRSLEEDMAHRASLWDVPDDVWALHASVPPARIVELAEALGAAEWVAEAAFGTMILRNVDEGLARAALERVGGSAFLARGDEVRFLLVDEAQRRLLRRLKEALDPQGRLAPLEW